MVGAFVFNNGSSSRAASAADKVHPAGYPLLAVKNSKWSAVIGAHYKNYSDPKSSRPLDSCHEKKQSQPGGRANVILSPSRFFHGAFPYPPEVACCSERQARHCSAPCTIASLFAVFVSGENSTHKPLIPSRPDLHRAVPTTGTNTTCLRRILCPSCCKSTKLLRSLYPLSHTPHRNLQPALRTPPERQLICLRRESRNRSNIIPAPSH